MTTASSLLEKYPVFDDESAIPRVGLLPLDSQEWIEISDDYIQQMAIKRELLCHSHDAVFKASAAAEAPAKELLRELVAHLLKKHGQQFYCDGRRLTNIATNENWELSELEIHPLDLCGRLVQDDICLMVPIKNEYRLEGASVCFPANWALSEKFGRSLGEIHVPVAGYQGRFGRTVDNFFQNIQAGRWFWRVNWFVHDDATLFQPQWKMMGDGVTADNAGETLWLRMERQTFHRLPLTGAVVLTFHTYIEKV